MPKKHLNVDWKSINGAATKKRVLRIKRNADGQFLCPITICLHVGFKSDRGLRKHIDSTHPWYYYFDEQPVVNREEAAKKDDERRKSSTHNMPAFSLTEGIGKEFLSWLSTPCGGGKSCKQGIEIGRRGMKFLMASMGATEVEKHISEEYVDCCIGSPSIIMNFLKLITEKWRLSSSAALNYMKAINDLLDFRKANGVSDDVLRSFTVSEVYIRRGKENLSKQKKLEYSRNLDLEKLIARESWATVEEMEEVIPYHTPKYKHVLRQCNTGNPQPSITYLAFATRFIATFLFLRVKCTRPMTYQFITVQMLNSAKTNGGFIDQTAFKTEEKYAFDTLILSPDVLQILDNYVTIVRPLLHPTCDYLVLTTNGTQYTAFGSAMSLLVHQAIGKYVNPTRYRQIIETESAERLTPTEMDTISKDQKHSSYVAKRVYQKRLSREVATQGKSCMEKIVGTQRDNHTKELASTLCEVSGDDDSESSPSPCNYLPINVDKSESEQEASSEKSGPDVLVIPIEDAESPSCSSWDKSESVSHCNRQLEQLDSVTVSTSDTATSSETKVVTRSSLSTPVPEVIHDDNISIGSCIAPADKDVHGNTTDIGVDVKREEVQNDLANGIRLKRFTPEEDTSLKEGVRKYGVGRWSHILRDQDLKFHPSRTRDSLRMRADTIGITNKRKRKKKTTPNEGE